MTDIEVLEHPLSKETAKFYRQAITNSIFLAGTFVQNIGGQLNFTYYGGQLDKFSAFQDSVIDRIKLDQQTITQLENFNNCLRSFLYYSFNFFYRIVEISDASEKDFDLVKIDLYNWFSTIEHVNGLKVIIDQKVIQNKLYDAIYIRKFCEKGFEDAVALLTANSIDLRLCPLNIVIEQIKNRIRHSVDIHEIELFSKLRGEDEEKQLCKFIINVQPDLKALLLKDLASLFFGKKGKPLAIMVYILKEYNMLTICSNMSEFHRALDSTFDWEIGALSGFKKILSELPECENTLNHNHGKDVENARKLMEPLLRFKL
jgi:hypothetical protein